MTAVHFGALVPQGWKREFAGLDPRTAYRTMIETSQACERAGYDSIWLYDHFHSVPPPPVATPVFECWTSMMALAERTERVRLGQMVTCTPYRNPGIGYLADTVEILKRMWSEEKSTFEGTYASVKDAFCDPKPLQSPRPPLWIGGGGEKLTLRVVARHADYANFGGKPEEWARKRDILFSHCEKVGRDPSEIRLTLHQDALVASDEAGVAALLAEHPSLWGEADESRRLGHLIGTPEQVVERIETYVGLGASGFVVWFPDYPSTDSMELFASEVMPHFDRG